MASIQKSLLPIIFLSIFVVKIFSQSAGLPPPPPFLEGAPQNKITEFHQLLIKSGQKTDGEIEQLVKDWIDKQTPEIQVIEYFITRVDVSIYLCFCDILMNL